MDIVVDRAMWCADWRADAARCRPTVARLWRPVSPQLPRESRHYCTSVPTKNKMLGIDTEALILAVKKRPALYNKNDRFYYNNKKHKSKLWFEVCKEVFSTWDSFQPQTKVEQGERSKL